jgi:hypothetical protein
MKKIYSLVLLFCFLSSQAQALLLLENGALDQINNSVALDFVGLNLNYKESFLSTDVRDNGVMPKSTESGTVFGCVLDTRTTFFKDLIYTNLYLDYYRGLLTYDGRYQDPPYAAVATKFHHTFFNAGLKTGYVFTFTENHVLQAIPYVGVGYHYWGRQNDNYPEKYHHYKATVGVRINWLLNDNFILSPYVEGGRIFSACMKYPHYNLSWSLGKKPIYEGGIELNYRLFDEFFLNGFASYTQFKYGRSGYKTSSVDNRNYFEPDSKTREIKFGLGIRYSWVI